MSNTTYITLNDGKKIPSIGFGNMHGWENGYTQKAEDVPAFALKQGFRHLDTAQIYKTEEETVNAIKAAGLDRRDVWVTSKIWKNDPRVENDTDIPTDPSAIRKSVESTVSRLGGPPDLWLIHNPYIPESGKIGEFWKILEDLVEDGTLRGTSLGVSNFRPQDLKEVLEVCRIKPVVNQLEFHPYLLAQMDDLFALQAEHGIITQSYGTLSPVVRHPTGGPLKPVLTRIAEKLSKQSGKDIDEGVVLILWNRDKGIIPITTSAKEENIKKAAVAIDFPKLSEEDMKEIEEAGRKIHWRAQDEHMTKDFPVPDLPSDI